jgi:hypothetical protein
MIIFSVNNSTRRLSMFGFLKKLFGSDAQTNQEAGIQIEQAPYKVPAPAEVAPVQAVAEVKPVKAAAPKKPATKKPAAKTAPPPKKEGAKKPGRGRKPNAK